MTSKLNVSRVHNEVSKRVQAHVFAHVTDSQQLSPTLARVVIAFSAESQPEEMWAAVARAFKAQASAVDNSFRPIKSTSRPTYVGFVRANNEVLDFSEAEKRNMTAVNSNLLVDNKDETMWEVRESAGAKVLMRQGIEDLSSVLSSVHTRDRRVTTLAEVAAVRPGERDFVAFVDPRYNEVRYGYALASEEGSDPSMIDVLPFVTEEEVDSIKRLQVEPGVDQLPDNASEETRNGNRVAQMMRDRASPISVGLDNLVETAHMNGNDSFPQLAAPQGSEKQKMIEYYKKVYSYDPAYYKKVVEIINGHAGI